MQLSDTHRFLLQKMLQYEIDNYIIPHMMEEKETADVTLYSAKKYLENRVKELNNV